MKPEDQSTTSKAGPTIVENYRDYEPPPKTREAVQLLLSYVPPQYLVDLHSIVLSNIGAFSRRERRQKTWSRRGKVRLTKTLGWYSRATRTSPASIRLNMDQIQKNDVDWFRYFPLLRYQALAQTLYHEIGHHIHTQHRPEYEGRENVADKWKSRLLRRFARQRYPYLIPVFWVLHHKVFPIVRMFQRGSAPANDATFRKRSL
jgi:hypothetical protein